MEHGLRCIGTSEIWSALGAGSENVIVCQKMLVAETFGGLRKRLDPRRLGTDLSLRENDSCFHKDTPPT